MWTKPLASANAANCVALTQISLLHRIVMRRVWVNANGNLARKRSATTSSDEYLRMYSGFVVGDGFDSLTDTMPKRSGETTNKAVIILALTCRETRSQMAASDEVLEQELRGKRPRMRQEARIRGMAISGAKPMGQESQGKVTRQDGDRGDDCGYTIVIRGSGPSGVYKRRLTRIPSRTRPAMRELKQNEDSRSEDLLESTIPPTAAADSKTKEASQQADLRNLEQKGGPAPEEVSEPRRPNSSTADADSEAAGPLIAHQAASLQLEPKDDSRFGEWAGPQRLVSPPAAADSEAAGLPCSRQVDPSTLKQNKPSRIQEGMKPRHPIFPLAATGCEAARPLSNLQADLCRLTQKEDSESDEGEEPQHPILPRAAADREAPRPCSSRQADSCELKQKNDSSSEDGSEQQPQRKLPIPSTAVPAVKSEAGGPSHWAPFWIAKYSDEAADGDDNDGFCGVCEAKGTLILCDNCPSSFHPPCVALSGELPEGAWYCPSCRCLNCGDRYAAFSPRKQSYFKFTFCAQCERQVHGGCVRPRLAELAKRCVPLRSSSPRRYPGSCGQQPNHAFVYFCDDACEKIYLGLRSLVNRRLRLQERGFAVSLLRSNLENTGPYSNTSSPLFCQLQIDGGLRVLRECFNTYRDSRFGLDMLAAVCHSRAHEERRLNFKSFYTFVLMKNGAVVSVANIRGRGERVAEIPFVATEPRFQGRGYGRKLMTALEEMLSGAGIETLVLPAATTTTEMWIRVFGFRKMTKNQKIGFVDLQMLHMAETVMLWKHLPRRKNDHRMKTAASSSQQILPRARRTSLEHVIVHAPVINERLDQVPMVHPAAERSQAASLLEYDHIVHPAARSHDPAGGVMPMDVQYSRPIDLNSSSQAAQDLERLAAPIVQSTQDVEAAVQSSPAQAAQEGESLFLNNEAATAIQDAELAAKGSSTAQGVQDAEFGARGVEKEAAQDIQVVGVTAELAIFPTAVLQDVYAAGPLVQILASSPEEEREPLWKQISFLKPARAVAGHRPIAKKRRGRPRMVRVGPQQQRLTLVPNIALHPEWVEASVADLLAMARSITPAVLHQRDELTLAIPDDEPLRPPMQPMRSCSQNAGNESAGSSSAKPPTPGRLAA